MLKVTRVDRVTDELSKKSNKLKIGSASCLKIANKDIAIGTSNGFILMYNMEEQLRAILGSSTGILVIAFLQC